MTLQQLGDRVSITAQQIMKYETGANEISASQMRDIATALEVPAVRRLYAPPHAKWSRGGVARRQISPIKSGPRPIETLQGRVRSRMPIVLPLLEICRIHLGNPG